MKDNGYGCLARYFDRLTADVDYNMIAGYTLAVFMKHAGRKPELMADLACGTGSLAVNIAGRGVSVIGIDGSSEMLSRAYSKSAEANTDILFLHQDICHFELYGTVDLITCYLDSINHIRDPEELKNLFILAANYLEPGGLFIFDVDSKYKFENIYANNVFFESYDDLTYIWQNRYNKKSQTAVFDLMFFIKDRDGRYRKDEDRIRERYYSGKKLRAMFGYASLDLIAEYDGFSFNKVKNDSQRILYILKSRKTFSNEK